jgi:hypothetical protein
MAHLEQQQKESNQGLISYKLEVLAKHLEKIEKAIIVGRGYAMAGLGARPTPPLTSDPGVQDILPRSTTNSRN